MNCRNCCLIRRSSYIFESLTHRLSNSMIAIDHYRFYGVILRLYGTRKENRLLRKLLTPNLRIFAITANSFRLVSKRMIYFFHLIFQSLTYFRLNLIKHTRGKWRNRKWRRVKRFRISVAKKKIIWKFFSFILYFKENRFYLAGG